MSQRVLNFYPGPCTLPYEAVEAVHRECLDFENSGMSLWETSHRTPGYERIHREAVELVHEVLEVPESHRVLMLGAGGSLQFAMIPMNLLGPGAFAEYVNTGYWANRAIEDARVVGDARVIASSEEDGFKHVPKGYPISPDARYLYLCTNNTIYGTELHQWPDTGGVPIVADVSSDLLTRTVDWSRVQLGFAGLTKNLGPAGMAVVIIEKELLSSTRRDLPSYLRYDVHDETDSMLNTPPMFSIAIMRRVLQWTRKNGGLTEMARQCGEKARMLYETIDAHPDYYRCPVAKEDRSRTNVVWHMPTEALERKFCEEAGERGMIGLPGHFLVGHCRASLYNAMSVEGVGILVQFMEEFRRGNPS